MSADKKIKLTQKVRRGLALARGLLVDSFDHDAMPSDRQVSSWPKYQQAEFNAAMAWLEQNEAKEAAVAETGGAA